ASMSMLVLEDWETFTLARRLVLLREKPAPRTQRAPPSNRDHDSARSRRDNTLQTVYASRGRSCLAMSPVQNSPPTSSEWSGRLPGASGSLCSCAYRPRTCGDGHFMLAMTTSTLR